MGLPSRTTTRAGAWLWLGCLQFFVVEFAASLAWPGRYSYRGEYISALGTAHSPLHALMNASFLVQGVLIAGGALLVPRWASPRMPGVLARGFLVLAGIGVALVGYAPEDRDLNLHLAGARLNFACGSLGMLFWAVALLARRRTTGQGRHAAAVAFWAAAVAIFGDLLLFFGMGPSGALLGGGTVERIAADPLPLWLAWTGWRLLHRTAVEGDL